MTQTFPSCNTQSMQSKARHSRHTLYGIALVCALSTTSAPAIAAGSIDDLWSMTIAAANSIAAQAQANNDKKALHLIVDEVQQCMTRVNDALANNAKPDTIVRECAQKVLADVCTGTGFANTSTALSIKSTPECGNLADAARM